MKRQPHKPLLAGLVTVEIISAVFAWRDLARRSDNHIRGNRDAWRIFITLNPGNSLLYWLCGRR